MRWGTPLEVGGTSYHLDLERGGKHPRLVCSLATSIMPLDPGALHALDQSWAPPAAAAPELLAPKATVSLYVV